MDISSVPSKRVELEALAVKDAKIRRLFIITDGKRTVSEIISEALLPEQEGLAGLQELLEHNYITLDNAYAEENRLSPSAFLKIVTEELAEFVGPFAAVAMEPFTGLEKKDSESERRKVIDAALTEIDSREDREKLIKALDNAGCFG